MKRNEITFEEENPSELLFKNLLNFTYFVDLLGIGMNKVSDTLMHKNKSKKSDKISQRPF